ncbi:uncharacterized protein BJ212DRAFT_1263293, partial [Suillus subaureus]
GLRRVVTLFDSIKDLVAKNDQRYDNVDNDTNGTVDQDQLLYGYSILVRTLPWFLKKTTDMEHDDYVCMLKMLRQGVDGTWGDDTSKLKTLVSDWVNLAFKPTPPVDPDDKHCHGFINDACGRLLCPTELDWNNPAVQAGIRDQSEGYVVMDLSFPVFLYEKYTANPDDLEEGIFKGKILLQAYKAAFTSPSSAKDIECDSDGADVIENNKHAKMAFSTIKVQFALSSVTSWRSINGDFDYTQFWWTIVDFFEKPPSQDARRRVERLLKWWTRKVFGKKHCSELSNAAKANMSVNTLARQRAQHDDAAFDSS